MYRRFFLAVCDPNPASRIALTPYFCTGAAGKIYERELKGDGIKNA